MKFAININPALLKWAREQTDLSLDDVVLRAGIKAVKATKKKHGLTPKERLLRWENGSEPMTLSQLTKLAKFYQRPLMTFFLPVPPKTENKLMDFRTFGSTQKTKDSPTFARLKRRLEILQEELTSLTKESKSMPLDFIGTVDLKTDVAEFACKVRNKLDFSFEQQLKVKDDEELFKVIREKIQELGVYVVVEGDLGSTHTAISPEEFRGIAITDKFAPLIAINAKDCKQARLFTLLHELAHIWLGDSSISNVSVNDFGVNEKEVFCNKFAAEFLLPSREINKYIPTPFANQSLASLMDSLKNLSKYFKVSLMVIARRLYDLKKITKAAYHEVFKTIQTSIQMRKKKQKETKIKVNRNVMDRYRLGSKVITTVADAAYAGQISVTDAAHMLNINYTRIDKVLAV